jgi:hypothetical protein
MLFLDLPLLVPVAVGHGHRAILRQILDCYWSIVGHENSISSLTVSILSNTMRRCIGNKDDHLASVLPPLHIQCLRHRSCDRFRAIPTPRSIQARQIFVNFADIGGKTKIPCDIGMILWWMISESNQTDTKIFTGLEFARFKNMGTDLFNIFGCR